MWKQWRKTGKGYSFLERHKNTQRVARTLSLPNASNVRRNRRVNLSREFNATHNSCCEQYDNKRHCTVKQSVSQSVRQPKHIYTVQNICSKSEVHRRRDQAVFTFTVGNTGCPLFSNIVFPWLFHDHNKMKMNDLSAQQISQSKWHTTYECSRKAVENWSVSKRVQTVSTVSHYGS